MQACSFSLFPGVFRVLCGKKSLLVAMATSRQAIMRLLTLNISEFTDY